MNRAHCIAAPSLLAESRKAPFRPACRPVRIACCLTLLLAGCSTVHPPVVTPAEPTARPAARAPSTGTPGGAVAGMQAAPPLPAAGSGRGGYYLDDGPGDAPPPDLQSVPDATPKIEPYSTRGNKPYVVFGKTYVPVTDNQPMKQRGRGSWYGKKFHGQKTSSGELYDMYKMTAAHPTLPIPSYARVTNLKNGAQVIVRVNDRGPFHSSRIIDLSYTAALKLGYVGHGSADLEVERLLPDEIARMNSGAAPRVTSTAGAMPVARPESVPVPAKGATPVTGVVPATASASAYSLDEFLKTQDANAALPVTMTAASAPADRAVGASSGAPPSLSEATLPAVPITPTLPGTATGIAGPGMTTATTSAANPTVSAPGFYMQFGAYSQAGNAEAARRLLMPQWPATLPALEVQQNGMLYRLYSGPFGSRGDAVQAASLLSGGLPASPQSASSAPITSMPKPVIVRR